MGRGRADATPAPARRRNRLLVTIALIVAAVVVVPTAAALPRAVAVGSTVRRVHGELGPLGKGWTGSLEYTTEASGKVAVEEWSFGTHSVIDLEPGWTSLRLGLEPVTCAAGGVQVVTVHAPGSRAVERLRVRSGFHTYRLGLRRFSGAPDVVLGYRCLVVPASLLRSDPNGVEPLAVAVDSLVAVSDAGAKGDALGHF
jgi:hypothetical protein